MSGKKLLGIYLPVDLIKRLKVFVASNFTKYKNVSEVSEKAIEEFLKNNDKPPD